MEVKAGKVEKTNIKEMLKSKLNEERRLSEMMIPKKKRRLYNKIMYAKKKKSQEVRNPLKYTEILQRNVNFITRSCTPRIRNHKR